jgi:murein endopeptidase
MGARPRRGWRDTDVWLDPDDVEWFGDLSRKMRAAVLPQPLLAGIDGGAVAWPGVAAPPIPVAKPVPVRRRRPGPSRGQKLATRLLPTVAALAAVPMGVTLLFESRDVQPVSLPPTAEPARASTASSAATDALAPASVAPVVIAEAPAAEPPAATAASEQAAAVPRIRWRASVAVGVPHAGQLVDGVRLPVKSADWVTWDPVLHRVPNRANRMYGTDALVRMVLDVVAAYRVSHPSAPRVVIGDLSRIHGGDIDEHVSHENGLDVDIYYPRRDGKLRPPRTVAQVDTRLAQDLLDRFVAAGAQVVFVGQSTSLRGPGGVVVPYPNHDNHMHVRISPPR